MKGIGLTQIMQQIDALITHHNVQIERLEKLRKNLISYSGTTHQELSEQDINDEKVLDEFIQKKFVGKTDCSLERSLTLLNDDPKHWVGLINPKLYRPINFPTLIKKVKEAFENASKGRDKKQ